MQETLLRHVPIEFWTPERDDIAVVICVVVVADSLDRTLIVVLLLVSSAVPVQLLAIGSWSRP